MNLGHNDTSYIKIGSTVRNVQLEMRRRERERERENKPIPKLVAKPSGASGILLNMEISVFSLKKKQKGQKTTQVRLRSTDDSQKWRRPVMFPRLPRV